VQGIRRCLELKKGSDLKNMQELLIIKAVGF
jgi:hypothetical protein